ncbi:hypothetical protein RvY_02457 [Ramazzottius varieornatus]|uniref:Uncharacterized protein n=1 Tax=Ramazzottius varieornatus TaxID=947166 RepID=A0A1D1UUB3_RAMVA|nr:hypothetical protein RvY_02457 [Ramazzottius varieornatus]
MCNMVILNVLIVQNEIYLQVPIPYSVLLKFKPAKKDTQAIQERVITVTMHAARGDNLALLWPGHLANYEGSSHNWDWDCDWDNLNNRTNSAASSAFGKLPFAISAVETHISAA